MLRERKNRRYNETNDEEGDYERKYDIKELIESERFQSTQFRDKHLQELPGDAITLRLIQRSGFEKPILVSKPDGLNLRVPPKNFLVRDIRNHVGHQRIIDVMDVKTQKNIEMSMKDWCKYYESKNRDRLLNVISLEFSHTKLDELVDSPMIVKLLDWVDLIWPKFLKESQTESTNSIDKMKYPKVQKYCLMSVKGSYTDFHIDFGGTSVWYHILRGKKIFWMVPPTDLNLSTFEEWTLSGMQQDVFFGDTVEECFRVELTAGNTFFIPSGWIHAVYTLEDSLVFGGNFLHSFGIENQLKVSKIEDATKVPIKFRYPFYTEMLWYAVQHYVHCITNKDHLHRPVKVTPPSSQEKHKPASNSQPIKSKTDTKNVKVDDFNDETTESEQEESDITSKKTKKSTTSYKKRKRANPTKDAQVQKKSKKVQSSEDSATEEDNDSTEVDSSNEEYFKPQPKTNTCRMTKNSLLRLQYEIDDQELSESKIHRSKSGSSKTSGLTDQKSSCKKPTVEANSKPTPTSTPDRQQSRQALSSSDSTNKIVGSNLTDELPNSQDSKPNGWTTSVSNTVTASSITPFQSIWSTAVSKEPDRIHLTKYELNGLKALVKHLSKLSGAKKNLPTLIRNSRALLDDCRKMIVEHENDDSELAVTGKPITLESLKSSRSTDMNELIGQFFKSPEDETASKCKELSSTFILSSTRIKNSLETTTPSKITDLEKRTTSNSGAILAPSSTSKDPEQAKRDPNPIPKSPYKETKCLSPNKKTPCPGNLSSAVSASSPPPKPKSPPTRPLSNNQYSSKQTKTDNNLLLPGSFADLIAATSTEKKVFDVSSYDASTPSVNSTQMKHHHSKFSSTSNKSSKDRKSLPSVVPKSPTYPSIDDLSTVVAPSVGYANGAATSKCSVIQSPQSTATVNKSHASPEPPKMSPVKRFINPQTFKPPQKEKLIFASAPYVSPVHASEQQRNSAPYPWQTPTQNSSTPSSQIAQQQSTSTQPSLLSSQPQQPQVYNPTLTKAPQPATKPPTPPRRRSPCPPLVTTQPTKTASYKPESSPPIITVTPAAPPKTTEPTTVIQRSPITPTSSTVPTSLLTSTPLVPPSPRPTISQPSYLISRPLLFNTIPSFTHAQFQAMQRHTSRLPLLSTPLPLMNTSLGLPFQQNARIVWATHPRAPGPAMAQTNTTPSIAVPPIKHNTLLTLGTISSATSSTTTISSANASCIRQPANIAPKSTTPAANFSIKQLAESSPPSTKSTASHIDNAALLSLATTALSTASMAGQSPAMPHMTNQTQIPPIMVNSPVGLPQPSFFPNSQPVFAPLMQRMPMTQFVTRPGGPRQSGQLVFARLPSVANHMQNLPRFLITQPGFLPQHPPNPVAAHSSASPLDFTSYKPTVATDNSKTMKPKKVKTN